MSGFVVVHCGAGTHSKQNLEAYRNLCKEACSQALQTYGLSKCALEAVTNAIQILEDSFLTNAGYGSSLTWNGLVECDASVMDGHNLNYGACGAVTTIKNPIELAKYICRKQNIKLALGRTPPCLLVGSGAQHWASIAGVAQVSNSRLISTNAQKQYKKNKAKVSEYGNLTGEPVGPLDTVGAIFVADDGRTTAGCSSGGLSLKHSGRVGQAASYASGCWAHSKKRICYGSSTSGCGEQIIKTLLAKQIVDDLKEGEIPAVAFHNTMSNKFVNCEELENESEKLAGAIAVKYDSVDGTGELIWGHTTPTMYIGYANSFPRVKFKGVLSSKLESDTVMISGKSFKLHKNHQDVL